MFIPATRIALPISFLSLSLIAVSPKNPASEDSSLVTLWAKDELRSAFSFDTGNYAVEIVDGQAVLDGAQIAFDLFEAQQLSTGFVNNQAVRVLDLGDLQVEGYVRSSDRAPHPPISIFHTLFLDGRTFYYRGPLSRSYSLKIAEPIFQTLTTGQTISFTPELGHTYLMRYAPKRSAGAEEKLVKFRVVDYQPGRLVTIRWARME